MENLEIQYYTGYCYLFDVAKLLTAVFSDVKA